MSLMEKHTGKLIKAVQCFKFTKGSTSLFTALFFLLFLSQGFAADNSESLYNTGNATIVYTTTDSNNVVITQGKITALEGKTIRLLPGTHIKSSAQLTVNIASKACQEEVAIIVEKEKEKTMLASVAKHREEVIPEENNAPTTAPFGFSSLPAENNKINQQRTELAACLVTTTVSFNAQLVYLLRNNDNSIVNHNSKIITRVGYTPVCSWGDISGTVKVMRC